MQKGVTQNRKQCVLIRQLGDHWPDNTEPCHKSVNTTSIGRKSDLSPNKTFLAEDRGDSDGDNHRFVRANLL